MTAVVSRARAIPLHVQIRQAIQADVTEGVLPPGAQLPPEHEYARRFGVSLAPVRQALNDLVNAGVIVRMKGRGTFVREERVEEEFDLLRSFTDNLRARGVAFTMSVVDRSVAPAPPVVAAALALGAHAESVHLRRLASIEHEPVAILESWLPADRFRGVLTVGGLDGGRSLWSALEDEFGVTLGVSRSTVEIVRLADDQADLLLQGVGTPALLLSGVAEDTAGQPVELSRTYYRADRFRFTVKSYRNGRHGAGHGR